MSSSIKVSKAWDAFCGFALIHRFVMNIRYDKSLGFTMARYSEYQDQYAPKWVTIVGSNPSNQSPDCSAFHPDTKSRKFVDKWFESYDYRFNYVNLVDEKTEGNKKLSRTKIKQNIWRIKATLKEAPNMIACGKTAVLGLKMAGFEEGVHFFEMPHPSGLCRFWNDKKAGEEKVKEMHEWIKNSYKSRRK